MKRLVKIKTLESRVWELCKQITRARYGNTCISCGKEVHGNQQHTGHYFRKKFVPLQIKYRLDILRVQCSYCNLRLAGNLEWYTIGLIKEGYTTDKFLEIAQSVEEAKANPLTVPQQREYLLELEQQYVTILTPYQRSQNPS